MIRGDWSHCIHCHSQLSFATGFRDGGGDGHVPFFGFGGGEGGGGVGVRRQHGLRALPDILAGRFVPLPEEVVPGNVWSM